MFSNFFYLVRAAWRHRKSLGFYRHCRRTQAKTILEIDPDLLYRKGIRILVLDFDGVLSAQDKKSIHPAVRLWVEKCIQIFGAGQLFILSNQPTTERIEWVSEKVKGVEFFLPLQKKPNHEGLLGIMALYNAVAFQVCMIDDRLTTGILAAIMSQTQAIWITSPWTDYRRCPCKELYYAMIRAVEKTVLFFCTLKEK